MNRNKNSKSSILFISISLFLICDVTAFQRETDKAQYIEGSVYEDVNKNGVKDQGESGIPGVMVSNQKDVVVTNGNGYYRLPIEEETIVFVAKPAGYELPLDKNNLPRFYYIHQPEGSPKLKYEGLNPTSVLPETVNFGLVSSDKKESFTAIVFGDPQARNNKELSYFRDDIVSELVDIEADLTLVLGDIMFNDLSLYDRYNNIMQTLGMPVYNLVGNHDINFDAGDNRYSKETFKRYYGPTYYSFDYGDVHFIALNNVDYEGRNEAGSAQYRGYLGERQLTWIENNLKHVDRNKLIVFLSHIPLYSDDGRGKQKNTADREKLINLLENRNRVLYLSGHRHRIFHNFLGKESGRLNSTPIHHIATVAASGAWWDGPKNEYEIPIALQRDGVPNGYHIFHFEGNTYRERYKGAGHDPDYQMRIELPSSSVKVEEVAEAKVLVNVFNGNERSEVQFQINDDEEWLTMERVEKQFSPFFKTSMEGYRKPGPSNHFWKAKLPVLKPGVHKITVRTRDMYGREFIESKVIEVE